MPRAFELDLDRQFHIMFLSTTRCNGGRPLSSLAVVFLGILSSVYAQDRTTEQGEAQITGELAFFNFSQNVWSCKKHTSQVSCSLSSKVEQSGCRASPNVEPLLDMEHSCFLGDIRPSY